VSGILAGSWVGFVGTGVMGRSMAGHLMDAGYRVRIHTRTREKARMLEERGAVWCSDLVEVVTGASVVISMVGYPADVEATYLGDAGLVERAAEGTVLADMTTSSPSLAEEIAAAGMRRGIRVLDAPVSGGDLGAREARLVIMVGGDVSGHEVVLPLFQRMGKTVEHLGGPGSGQRCKMANQVAVAVGMVAWVEALVLAEIGGLEPAKVQGLLAGGAAGSWAFSQLAPRALSGDFAPGFFVKHLVKDIGIALGYAAERGLELPGLETAGRLYRALEGGGYGDDGTQALYRFCRARAGL
jgi:3-hydroxyisobutyrate dehydrogenase